MMRNGFQRTWRLALITMTGLAAAIAWVPPPLQAGQASPNQATRPVPVGQSQAVDRAIAQGLNYVPGEVIFKFKKNTPAFLQQRALTAIRSRPRLADVHWMHDIGLIHDDLQPDANVLAQQLGEQSEVEFAHPNYLR